MTSSVSHSTSSRSLSPSERKRRIIKSVSVGVIAASVWISAIVHFGPQSNRLQPGQIVEEFGTFRSPRGHFGVKISETTPGIISVTRLRAKPWLYFFTTYEQERPHDFDAERDWFVSFDNYDRLWTFRGKWDVSRGRPRRLPSGGSVPYYQAVSMTGFWFTPSRLVRGSNVVSHTGQWTGVPAEFLERIPGKGDEVWGGSGIRPIPIDSPPFTRSQQREIEKSWTSKMR